MDYLYGELNNKVSPAFYEGGITETADVVVDNSNNVIYVNAHVSTSALEAMVQEAVDEAIAEMDVPDVPVATQLVDSVSQENGLITVHRRTLIEGDIPQLTISKITNLQTKLDEKQDVLGFEGTYDKTTNKVVTNDYLTSKNYIVQGTVANSDIVADANIAQSKVQGLTSIQESVTVLEGDASVQGSVAQKIQTAINALDSVDYGQEHKFVTVVTELNGLITVTRVQPVIADILGLTDELVNLTPAVITCGTGEVLSGLSYVNGKETFAKKTLLEADIPTLSYTKISGLANVAHTGSYTDLINVPTATYSSSTRTLTLTGI